jgi:hypothetical protein
MNSSIVSLSYLGNENRPSQRVNRKESASTAKRREASLKSCEKNGLPEWKEFNEGFEVSLTREIRPESRIRYRAWELHLYLFKAAQLKN